MGDHALYVRFPDGEIRFGTYNSASDIACPKLSTSLDDAYAALADPHWRWPTMDGSGDAVEVATIYGDGFWWRATATREWLTSHVDPFDSARTTDGWPDWLTEYVAASAFEDHVTETAALDRAMLNEMNGRLAGHLAGGGADASG